MCPPDRISKSMTKTLSIAQIRRLIREEYMGNVEARRGMWTEAGDDDPGADDGSPHAHRIVRELDEEGAKKWLTSFLLDEVMTTQKKAAARAERLVSAYVGGNWDFCLIDMYPGSVKGPTSYKEVNLGAVSRDGRTHVLDVFGVGDWIPIEKFFDDV